MADEIVQGGLSQAAPPEMPPEMPSEAAPAPQFNDYFARVAKQKEESIQLLKNRQAKLLELTNSRKNQMFDPQLLALSSALLRPTKTGSFGESLGYAAEALGSEQEKRIQREQAEAKMQMELEQMTQEQNQQMMSRELMMELAGAGTPFGQPPAVAGAPAVTPAAAPVDGATAVPQLAGAPQAAVQAPPAAAQKSGLDRFTDEQLRQLFEIDPKNNAYILNFMEDRRKRREFGLKERDTEAREASQQSLERGEEYEVPGAGKLKIGKDKILQLNALVEAGDFSKVIEWYQKNNIPLNIIKDPKTGVDRFMTPSEVAFEQEKRKAQLTERPEKYLLPEVGKGEYLLLPSEYLEIREARKQGKQAVQNWFDKNKPEFNVRVAEKAVQPDSRGDKVESVADRAAREAGESTFSTEMAKSQVEDTQSVLSLGKTARERIALADDLYKLASNPKYSKVFGILEKATPDSALGKMISEGVSFGKFNVGVPQLRQAIIQVGGTPEDQDTFRQVMNLYTRAMFINGNLMKGEGATSNYEREMQVMMAGSIADTPKTAMARAEYMKLRGAFDSERSKMYRLWSEENPNKSFDAFKLKYPKYEKLEDSYYKKLQNIGNKYFPELKTIENDDGKPSTRSSSGSAQGTTGGRLVWDPKTNDWKR